MAIEFEIRMHGEILEFEVSGEYCFQDSIDKFPLVLQAVKASGVSKCQIDFLSLPEAGGGTEQSLYAFSIERMYKEYLAEGGHPLAIAYVGPPSKRYQPAVDHVENRDMPIKIFSTRDEAIEWLREFSFADK